MGATEQTQTRKGELGEFLAQRITDAPWSFTITEPGKVVAIHQGSADSKWRPALFTLQPLDWGCFEFTDDEMAEFGRRIVDAINAVSKKS